jgi:argininosuccinate lyase
MDDSDRDIVTRGRLAASDDATERFLSILDEWVFDANLAIDRAHVVMLAERGIVDGAAARAVLGALEEVDRAGFDALPERGDVHVAIEEDVVDRIGEATGGVLHTARSRNDKGATYVRMALREDLLGLAGAVADLRATLVGRAGETADWLLSGYTHLQNAQPTTLGHHLTAYDGAFARDGERLLDAYGRTNRSPLGSCAVAGTGFDIDRERTASLLGFDRPVRNSMDAVAARDFATEAVAAASGTMTTVSRLCTDLFVWSSREFGFVELADQHTGSSSIMPQKKNPNVATAARSKAATVRGSLAALDSMFAGLPMSLNYDVWEANRHLRDALGTARTSVERVDDALSAAAFDRAAMAESAGAGFATATELADTLVREAGLPFRTAHHVVARIARDYDPEDVDAAMLDEVATDVTGEPAGLESRTVARALDPRHNVAIRDSLGGPGELEAALVDARERLAADRAALSGREDSLRDARERLADAVGAVRTVE